MQKILVIDDEAPLRQLILAALRTKGYAGLEAENGAAGVELARLHLPALVLCDVMMPKMDGYATLAAMRREAVTALIPFVLMTGRPDHAGMRQGMALGADDYLPKPFSIEELLATVETRLKKQATLRQEAEKKLSELRANISLAMPHELFTPLSGIVGFADIISNDAASLSAAEVAEIGRAISVSAERLHRIIENYLIYAQIEILAADAQKVASLQKSLTFNARGMIEKEALEIARKMDRAADLHLELADGSAVILEEYLRKITGELLSNAFKFSEPGMPVELRTALNGGHYQIHIHDQGRGMPPQQIANVGAYMQFERKVYEQQGSGLGLVIAKRLAEIHGGTLTFISNPGAGTTVTVTLPSRVS